MFESMSKITFESQLYSMTTIIECGVGSYKSYGSGFFYNVLAPVDPTIKGVQHRKVEGIYLITNRHVALPKVNDKDTMPDYLVFNLRKNTQDDGVEWYPMAIERPKLQNLLLLHPNSGVDVVAIKIDDYIKEIVKNQNRDILIPMYLSNDNLPNNNDLTIEVTSDIVVASYPRMFYDKVNKFPIVKSGIVASGWGLNFNNTPTFLIDAKLFPGSSGGLVLSKPTHLSTTDGKLVFSHNKRFVLLGVYSGEPISIPNAIELENMTIIRKDSYGLGTVWYPHLITEIINANRQQ